MRYFHFVATLLLGSVASAAQAPSFNLQQLSIGLPEEGAPVAVPGPYPTVTEPAVGASGLLVIRPAVDSLAPGQRLPVVAWGNGACLADGSGFAGYLSTVASWGFLVVTTAPVKDAPQARITSANLIAALDWAGREARRSGSPLAGRIDTDAVGVMGMSCGGNLAIEAARDPRVDTLGVWNSGVWISGEMRAGDGTLLSATTKDDLKRIHGPALYINGDATDPASVNAADDVQRLGHVPVFFGIRRHAGHAGTYSHRNGGEFANVASAWLRWRLKGDAESGRMFTGSECGLCTDPNWIVTQKGL
jgi:hypothetical protein